VSTKLQDIGNNAVFAEGLTAATKSSTSTGSACDMLLGDGRCHVISQVTTLTGTSVAVSVSQCATTNGTFTDITGAIQTITAAGISAFSFDRDLRYLKVKVDTANATSAVMGAVVLEQKKYVF
jgi:hypothetical protein